MIEKDWTWIEKLRVWGRPYIKRLCSNCGFKGYFKLRDTMTMVPGRPLYLEICPDCEYEIELIEGKDPVFAFPNLVLDKWEKIAREQGLTAQELIDEVFGNMIIELEPKTGKSRIVSRITGKEIKFKRKEDEKE